MYSFKYAVKETVAKLGDYIPNYPHKRLRHIIVKCGLEFLLCPFDEQEWKIYKNYKSSKKT